MITRVHGCGHEEILVTINIMIICMISMIDPIGNSTLQHLVV